MTLGDPDSIAISPDGRNVYVGSMGESSVAALARVAATGALRQLSGSEGCVARADEDEEASPSPCTPAAGLSPPPHFAGGESSVAVSPDGKNVYVTTDGAVAVFARSPSNGALTQPQGTPACAAAESYVQTGLTACVPARGLGLTTGIAVAPDGKSVVVSAWPIVNAEFEVDGGVAFFKRGANGALVQPAGPAACLTDLGPVSGCLPARGLHTDPSLPDNTNGLAMSADGGSLYVTTRRAGAETGTISVFTRRADGSFAQLPGALGCIGEPEDGCSRATGLQGVSTVATSPDGRNAYATAYWDDSLVVFSRARATVVLAVRKQGAGVVTSKPAGVACGTRCSAAFEQGSVVVVSAVPAKGWRFDGWRGLCRGAAASCSLTLSAPGTVFATFRKR